MRHRHAVAGCLYEDLIARLKAPAKALQRRSGYAVLVISSRLACPSPSPSQIATLPKVRRMSVPKTRRIDSPCQHDDGSGGRNHTYGFSFPAQLGASQTRRAINAASLPLDKVASPPVATTHPFDLIGSAPFSLKPGEWPDGAPATWSQDRPTR